MYQQRPELREIALKNLKQLPPTQFCALLTEMLHPLRQIVSEWNKDGRKPIDQAQTQLFVQQIARLAPDVAQSFRQLPNPTADDIMAMLECLVEGEVATTLASAASTTSTSLTPNATTTSNIIVPRSPPTLSANRAKLALKRQITTASLASTSLLRSLPNKNMSTATANTIIRRTGAASVRTTAPGSDE